MTDTTDEPFSEARPIRILIVDDQAMVRQGFGALLDAQEDMSVVGSAADGSEVVDLVRKARPDVVLMDIRMPRVNGLDATRSIFAMPGDQHPRVIMLTTFDADEYVFAALQAGASGFLLKDATAEDLAGAVRVVAGGEALLAPSITQKLIADYVSRPAVRTPDITVLGPLTDRELDVMRLVATGRSNAELAAELFLSEQTIKTHVSRILAKLGLRDRTQIVVTAYESGLVSAGS
ncbi:response regulator transcription factor [Citricoccus sp. I39-566]|uniref:response regulator transcription factor n=1 Tax=Citricoccus sp. I39-566 TaxID=3073268 RepID=UPI00286A3738|nr:response regulator transcription factor [Citricoccus sp. I39-566]WMY77203.1 response regulator transcription factor [Citricoccus sp. I39-566]